MKPFKRSLVFLFLLPVLSLQAQWSVGVYGGLNISKLRGDTPKDVYFKMIPNGDLGVLVSYNIRDKVIVSFQPYFTRKGTKVSFRLEKEEDPVDSVRVHFAYISFPLIFRVMTKKKKWYVLGGVEVAKTTHSFYTFVDGTGGKTDIGEKVTPVNAYIQFGVGRRWKVWNNKYLFGEFRYFQALVNTVRQEEMDPAYLPRVRTRGYQLSVGLEIPLTGKKKNNP